MSVEFEEWRAISGESDLYEVSSLGRVRSWTRRGGALRRFPTPVPLKASVNPSGYRVVTLSGKHHLLHRLVCAAFNGPAAVGQTDCRHLDGDSLNNLPENLAWGSRSDNEQDKVQHGRSNRGERCGNARLTAIDVLDMRTRYARGWRQADLAAEYGVTQSNVSNIVNRRSWAHVA